MASCIFPPPSKISSFGFQGVLQKLEVQLDPEGWNWQSQSPEIAPGTLQEFSLWFPVLLYVLLSRVFPRVRPQSVWGRRVPRGNSVGSFPPTPLSKPQGQRGGEGDAGCCSPPRNLLSSLPSAPVPLVRSEPSGESPQDGAPVLLFKGFEDTFD